MMRKIIEDSCGHSLKCQQIPQSKYFSCDSCSKGKDYFVFQKIIFQKKGKDFVFLKIIFNKKEWKRFIFRILKREEKEIYYFLKNKK